MTQSADSNFLTSMAESSLLRFKHAHSLMNDAEQIARLDDVEPPVDLYLSNTGFDLIAEVKRQSPAEGTLSDTDLAPEAQAASYISGGAIAISVLTEPERFLGSLDDLQRVVLNSKSVPVMRKDFLVSPYQVREARLAGASGVLLIAAILTADELLAMFETANELGMYTLLEVFTEADLGKAIPVIDQLGSDINSESCRLLLGVNCRDLTTLKINFAHFGQLAKSLPNGIPWVAESGLQTPEQAGQLAELGYRLALVGSALMRSSNPQQLTSAILAAGRAQCS